MCRRTKPFSDMTSGGYPENWVRTFTRGCLSHVNNAAGDSLLRFVNNSNTSGRIQVWDGGAGRGKIQCFNSAVEKMGFCVQHINTGIGPCHHKLS